MPSTATITSFYSFSADTRARASQVNTNFSNFRGTIVPIEVLTATSSDNTYDLGSDEHRWRTVYTNNIDLETSTSTASLTISGDTSKTLGAFLFKIEGTEVGRIGYGETINMTTSGYINSTVSTGTAYDLTNASLSITTRGKPIEATFTHPLYADTASAGNIQLQLNTNLNLFLIRGSTTITSIGLSGNASILMNFTPSTLFRFIDNPGAGSYTYKIQVSRSGSNDVTIGDCRFLLKEL